MAAKGDADLKAVPEVATSVPIPTVAGIWVNTGAVKLAVVKVRGRGPVKADLPAHEPVPSIVATGNGRIRS